MIALMQAEPAPGVFPMGWEFTRLNGRPVVHFEGGPANFQASLYFDPESKVGVFVAANVINALDTLSGARTKSLLDGISTRSMAASVMSLATDQPLPEQGIGIRRLSLLFDLVILALTGLQVVSFARIPRQYRRLERRGVKNTADLYRRSAGTSALHFIPPLGLLAAALKLPNWIILTLLQPDLIYWLYAMAALTSLKGLIEIGMVWRVFRRAPKGKSHG